MNLKTRQAVTIYEELVKCQELLSYIQCGNMDKKHLILKKTGIKGKGRRDFMN
jgi:hypothetical protein